MPTSPSKQLETFDNPNPDRDYIIDIETPEFTCLCPKTGQPDFATLYLEYVPDALCLELKSLKLYIWSYRDEGAFHEDVTNTILNDLVEAVQPRYLRLRAKFNVRGGVYTTVEAEFRRPGWEPPPPPPNHLNRVKQTLPERSVMGDARQAKPAERQKKTVRAELSERFRMLRRTRKPEPPPSDDADIDNDIAVREDEDAASAPQTGTYIGIDLGSTGCRIVAINDEGDILAQSQAPIPVPLKNNDQVTQDPTQWWKAVVNCLQAVVQQIEPEKVRTIAVDGTSGTLLLCDNNGHPVTPALMYDDSRALNYAKKIRACAGQNTGAHGATSSLAKLLWLQEKKFDKKAAYVQHQADWITGKLTGLWGHSDYNNCLKLGYDAETGEWPDWFAQLNVNRSLLPQVHIPGEPLGLINGETAKKFGLPETTQVIAGTTDGVASFLAADASEPGHGVTSLGTTLILKLLSNKPVFSPAHGVYSHRLGRYWLAGGASNSGGAVLLQYFKVDQMEEMTPLLDPESSTGLDYYPLPAVGERFPINDPNMISRLEPLPSNSVNFFQGMLEGIARIEAQGYQLLHKLGTPAVIDVRTTGGGSRNQAWTRIRERTTKVNIKPARSGMAAYGTAKLASGVVAKMFN